MDAVSSSVSSALEEGKKQCGAGESADETAGRVYSAVVIPDDLVVNEEKCAERAKRYLTGKNGWTYLFAVKKEAHHIFIFQSAGLAEKSTAQ